MPSLDDPGEYRERVCSRVKSLLDARGWPITYENVEAMTVKAVLAIPNPKRHPSPHFTPDEVRGARPTPPMRVLGVRRAGR